MTYINVRLYSTITIYYLRSYKNDQIKHCFIINIFINKRFR